MYDKFLCLFFLPFLPTQTCASSSITLLINQISYILVFLDFSRTPIIMQYIAHYAFVPRELVNLITSHTNESWRALRPRSFCALIWNINERMFNTHCLEILFCFFFIIPFITIIVTLDSSQRYAFETWKCLSCVQFLYVIIIAMGYFPCIRMREYLFSHHHQMVTWNYNWLYSYTVQYTQIHSLSKGRNNKWTIGFGWV